VLRVVDNPPKILVITTFENDEYVYQALRAGANGFLLKRSRPSEIVHAVRLVISGESLLFPVALRALANEYGNKAARQAMARALLTEREAAILRLMARGLSNADIAGQLVIGGAWVVLTVTFEILLGRAIGASWDRIFSDYNPARGGFMLAGLAVLFLAPWITRRRT